MTPVIIEHAIAEAHRKLRAKDTTPAEIEAAKATLASSRDPLDRLIAREVK